MLNQLKHKTLAARRLILWLSLSLIMGLVIVLWLFSWRGLNLKPPSAWLEFSQGLDKVMGQPANKSIPEKEPTEEVLPIKEEKEGLIKEFKLPLEDE